VRAVDPFLVESWVQSTLALALNVQSIGPFRVGIGVGQSTSLATLLRAR